MSTLVYNRIGLIRCQLLSYEREPVWHNQDYLYTRHRVKVRGLYNPETNAYTFTGGNAQMQVPATQLGAAGNAVPLLRPVPGAGRLSNIGAAGVVGGAPAPVGLPQMAEGTEAPSTDMALKHKLMQPRATLFFSIGNNSILVSPTLNSDGSAASLDVANGPVPLSVDVVYVSGIKSFLVDLAIETYLNESYLYATTPSVLLSHRWKRTESIDADAYSTIVTQGVARFRGDRLFFAGVVPDDFRGYLFHPVPPRCQRIDWNIEVSEDNNAIAYTLVDRITYLRIIPAGVSRVEAFQTVRAVTPGFGSVVQSMRKEGLFAGIAALVPFVEMEITVRVWGQPPTIRKVLESTAIRLIGVRFAAAIAGAFGGGPLVANVINVLSGNGLEITHDLNGSFVEVKAALSIPAPIDDFTPSSGSSITFPDVRDFFPAAPQNDAITGVLARDFVARNDLPDVRYNAGPGPNVGTGTRSAFIRSLAAAALGVPDTAPPIPGQPGSAFTPPAMAAVPLPP